MIIYHNYRINYYVFNLSKSSFNQRTIIYNLILQKFLFSHFLLKLVHLFRLDCLYLNIRLNNNWKNHTYMNNLKHMVFIYHNWHLILDLKTSYSKNPHPNSFCLIFLILKNRHQRLFKNFFKLRLRLYSRLNLCCNYTLFYLFYL